MKSLDEEMNINLFQKVYEILQTVPKGKVTTYGDIAKQIGNVRYSRQVGFALHCNPKPVVIPCHRVVNRFGSLAPSFAFGGIDKQKRLLEEEGVKVQHDKVDLSIYRYQF